MRGEPLVLVDVHGVVSDFTAAAHHAHGVEYVPELCVRYDFWRDWDIDISDDDFWEGIFRRGVAFWADTPTLAPGVALVDSLMQTGIDWAFCSAAVHDRNSREGTTEFCYETFGDCRVILTARKYLLAEPGVILIDDYPNNCYSFAESGGAAHVWPQPWNTNVVADIIVIKATDNLNELE